MLQTTPATQGLLFASFLYRQDLHYQNDFKELWENLFGNSFSLVPSHNPLRDYYAKEMGEDLARVFYLTSGPFPREFLLSTKLLAMEWESHFAREEKRTVNVDIGFLSLENFQLATTKNYSHRVYIGQNLFSDLTYFFHQGKLQALPWTYPDYLDEQKRDFFSWGRSYLLQNHSN